jgi:threonine dehydrogenase-like Zn-dependent dehydrogenase
MSLLGQAYSRIPPGVRPFAKRAAMWSMLRGSAVAQRKRVCHGRRVQFLDFEVAYLDDYEFLAPGRGEVLVEALRSCISPGTERAVLCGLPGARRRFPYTPGYSMCGKVRAAPASPKGIRAGDRVVGRMSHASLGLMNTTSLFKVPDGVSSDEASFQELGIITLQGIRKADIQPGDHVAVVGQGLIGQLAARMARFVGASRVTAVAASRRRMRSAMMPGGADEFVALTDGPHAIASLGADVVIEAVGSAKAILLAMDATRPGGRVSLLGSSRDLGRGIDWWSRAQARRLTLIGAHISALPARDASARRWTYEQEGQLFLELLASKRLSVADLITWHADPADCNRVYEVIAEGGREHVAIVFDWETFKA